MPLIRHVGIFRQLFAAIGALQLLVESLTISKLLRNVNYVIEHTPNKAPV